MQKTYSKKKILIKTRYGSFACVFEKESDMGGYAIEAEKVQGAVSWGKNFTEAKNMIKEAIEGIMEAQAVVEAEQRGAVRIASKPIPNFV